MFGDLLHKIEAGKNLRCEERPPIKGESGVVKVSAVTWGRSDPEKSKTLPPGYHPPEQAQIHAGDLLFSRANTIDLVGAVALVEAEPERLFLSDKVLRLVIEDDMKSWVLRFLRSGSGRAQIEQLATGNQLSMRNISQEALRRIHLPFPPLSERGRIVTKLHALTARLARARAELDRVNSLAAKQRETILAACIAQHLQEAPRVRFDEEIAILTSGSRDWAKYYDQGSCVFVLAGNIRTLRFDPTPKQFVNPPLDSADARRSKVEKDDILVTIVGAGTGDVCHGNYSPPCWVSQGR
jgi:type I restriction enzyme S subunit